MVMIVYELLERITVMRFEMRALVIYRYMNCILQ